MRDKKIKVKSEWRAADKGRHLKRCGYRTRFIIELCICIIIAMIITVFLNTETGRAAEQIGNEPGTLAGDAASDQADGLRQIWISVFGSYCRICCTGTRNRTDRRCGTGWSIIALASYI